MPKGRASSRSTARPRRPTISTWRTRYTRSRRASTRISMPLSPWRSSSTRQASNRCIITIHDPPMAWRPGAARRRARGAPPHPAGNRLLSVAAIDLVPGELRAFYLAPENANYRARWRGLFPARHAGGQGRVSRRTFQHARAETGAACRPAGQPHLPAGPAPGGDCFLYRLHHAARAERRALAAPEPVAQHPDHLLGLRDFFAGRCTAGNSGRHLRDGVETYRTLHRIRPLPAGAGIRRA